MAAPMQRVVCPYLKFAISFHKISPHKFQPCSFGKRNVTKCSVLFQGADTSPVDDFFGLESMERMNENNKNPDVHINRHILKNPNNENYLSAEDTDSNYTSMFIPKKFGTVRVDSKQQGTVTKQRAERRKLLKQKSNSLTFGSFETPLNQHAKIPTNVSSTMSKEDKHPGFSDNSIQSELNFIDVQYFDSSHSVNSKIVDKAVLPECKEMNLSAKEKRAASNIQDLLKLKADMSQAESTGPGKTGSDTEMNFIDGQYFGNVNEYNSLYPSNEPSESLILRASDNSKEQDNLIETSNDLEDLNYIDKQYFGSEGHMSTSDVQRSSYLDKTKSRHPQQMEFVSRSPESIMPNTNSSSAKKTDQIASKIKSSSKAEKTTNLEDLLQKHLNQKNNPETSTRKSQEDLKIEKKSKRKTPKEKTSSKEKIEVVNMDNPSFHDVDFGLEKIVVDSSRPLTQDEDMVETTVNEESEDKNEEKEKNTYPVILSRDYKRPPKRREVKKQPDKIPLGTAYSAAMDIRSKVQRNTRSCLYGEYRPTEVDSKGFRIMTNQVPDLSRVPASEVVDLLYEGIVYNDNDIVAINKPYNLASIEGPGVVHSVSGLLKRLAQKLDRNLGTLYLVHRLDKETTGVMLLARTEEMAMKLSDAFIKRRVIKKYLAITKNIPKHSHGEIDIPIKEVKATEGNYISVLRPYNAPDLHLAGKVRQTGKDAVTEYRVLYQAQNCALLECIAKTGLKHQVRVHLAMGIDCPILGDHKYSNVGKLGPQKLPEEMLKRLKIRQSKVRHVAMHLHARSVLLPEFIDGANIFISAPLPRHFIQNMKSLKLRIMSRTV